MKDDGKTLDYINDKNLNFEISGNIKYGLHKTIINAIRRTLLTNIETVAFNPEDIIIETNNSALHNEFMKHRISLMPLSINPTNYNRDLLFVLNVKNTENPVQSIYSSDFEIYRLKNEYQQEIYEQGNSIPDEDNIFTKLEKVSKDYYDLLNPLSDKEKKDIFNPFEFPKNNFNYFLLTELKLTGSETDFQELDLYCVPSIGTSKIHSRFNNLSTVTYSFTKNEEDFKQYLEDSVKISKLKKQDEKEAFSKSLRLKESERYYHKDITNEAYVYNFTVSSNHYYDSKTLYLQSFDILMERLTHIMENLKTMVSEPENSLFSYDRFKGDTTYQIIMFKEDDTTGNMIQAHMVNKFIDGTSLVQVCGYKKPHPLTELIIFNIMINPNDYTELQKKARIADYFTNTCKDLIDILDIMKREGSKRLG